MANGQTMGDAQSKAAVLREKLRTVDVDGTTFYLAEGDLLLDEDQLTEYAHRVARLEVMEAARNDGGMGLLPRNDAALVGVTQDGRVVRWAPGVVLSYTVLRQTFGSADEYDDVVSNMRVATENWQDTCGVQFEHKEELDDSATTTPDGVLFTVRGIDAGGRFIAAAFFPNEPAFRRRVLIDPSYFTTSFDRTGVLRHELGHVLGFRHEHIRSNAPAACPDEPLGDTIDLTDYDPQSVMHYFCGGVGTSALAITTVDKEGSRRVYGLPLSQLRLIEP